MIKIDRGTVVPTGLAKASEVELTFNLILEQAGEKMEFKAYKTPTVKPALEALFYRKCCYCESQLLGTQPGEIEHYRPKGNVKVFDHTTKVKSLDREGYFWLAGDWENLLYACADCNRPRVQMDYDGSIRTFGKGEFFPLEDTALADAYGHPPKEVPLLLNPCIDDPQPHLNFLLDGRIEPASINGVLSVRGDASIFFYGLARAELLQMRATHRKHVEAAIRNTLKFLKAGEDPGADLQDLLDMLKPSQPYLAYTKTLVSTLLTPGLEGLGLTLASIVAAMKSSK